MYILCNFYAFFSWWKFEWFFCVWRCVLAWVCEVYEGVRGCGYGAKVLCVCLPGVIRIGVCVLSGTWLDVSAMLRFIGVWMWVCGWRVCRCMSYICTPVGHMLASALLEQNMWLTSWATWFVWWYFSCLFATYDFCIYYILMYFDVVVFSLCFYFVQWL